MRNFFNRSAQESNAAPDLGENSSREDLLNNEDLDASEKQEAAFKALEGSYGEYKDKPDEESRMELLRDTYVYWTTMGLEFDAPETPKMEILGLGHQLPEIKQQDFEVGAKGLSFILAPETKGKKLDNKKQSAMISAAMHTQIQLDSTSEERSDRELFMLINELAIQ